jgi:hypothetical protein
MFDPPGSFANFEVQNYRIHNLNDHVISYDINILLINKNQPSE